MKSWLEVRAHSPEFFEHTEVMQQPRAVRDEIIIKWCQEDLKLILGDVPIPQQHDLLSTQWTQATRQNAFALGIMRSVIAGQMTARLQLTDVMSAKMSHEYAAEYTRAQGQLLRRKAISDGDKARLQVWEERGAGNV